MTYIYLEICMYLLIENEQQIVPFLCSAFPFLFGKIGLLVLFFRCKLWFCIANMLLFHTRTHSHQTNSLRMFATEQCAESICIVFMAYLPNMTPFESLSKYECLLLFLLHETVNGISFLLPETTTTTQKNTSKTVSIKHAIESIACRMLTQRAKTELNKQMKMKKTIDFMEPQKRFPWNWAVYLLFLLLNVDVYSVEWLVGSI